MLYGVKTASFCSENGMTRLLGITIYPSSPAFARAKSGVMEIDSVRGSISEAGIFRTAFPSLKSRNLSDFAELPSLNLTSISARSAAKTPPNANAKTTNAHMLFMERIHIRSKGRAQGKKTDADVRRPRRDGR